MMLVDTSGLFCCHHAGERQHADAVRLFRSASLSWMRQPLTCCPHVEIVWVDEDLHRAALAFLQQRLDKAYSLCDAVSFVLMRARGITEALTTDRHFEQEGFVRLLEP
jgi:uncharacterized protein